MVMWPLIIAAAVMLISAAAEYIHSRRISRIQSLVFGPSVNWTTVARVSPFLSVLSVTALSWSLCSLLLIPPRTYGPVDVSKASLQHLIIALDVSPSMRAIDAGVDSSQSRIDRSLGALTSIFKEIGTTKFTTSVIAFHTNAIPVVIQSKDTEVIRHLIGKVPLHYLFQPGMTDISDGIAAAIEIQKQFPAEGTSLIVLSDGDSETVDLPSSAGAFQDVVFLGVGPTHHGTRINDALTNQNSSVLTRLSAAMNGRYVDINDTNPPRNLLPRLSQAIQLKAGTTELIRLLSTICLIVSGIIWCVLPLVLQRLGAASFAHRPKVKTEHSFNMGLSH